MSRNLLNLNQWQKLSPKEDFEKFIVKHFKKITGKYLVTESLFCKVVSLIPVTIQDDFYVIN